MVGRCERRGWQGTFFRCVGEVRERYLSEGVRGGGGERGGAVRRGLEMNVLKTANVMKREFVSLLRGRP